MNGQKADNQFDLIKALKEPVIELNPTKLVDILLGVAEKIENSGFSAIEPLIDDTKNPFIASGLENISEGVDPAMIMKIIDLQKEAMVKQVEAYFEVLKEGLLLIQDARKKEVIGKALHAILGKVPPIIRENLKSKTPLTRAELKLLLG